MDFHHLFGSDDGCFDHDAQNLHHQNDHNTTLDSHHDTNDAIGHPTLHFGGYSSDYDGIKNCWYSSDGRVYDPMGNCIGTY